MEKQKELRKKVLCIVEKMLENPVAPEWLIKSCQFIIQDDYNDVVNERNIIKLCGYPLCPNILTKVSRQKYRICMKSKKVYDITERKNFCSGNCYKASNYLKAQILTTPLWMRDDDEVPQISLLPTTDKSGISGEEIEMHNRLTKLESESIPQQTSQIKILTEKTFKQIGSPYIENEDIMRCASQLSSLEIKEKTINVIYDIDTISDDSDDDEIPSDLPENQQKTELDTSKEQKYKEESSAMKIQDVKPSSEMKCSQIEEKSLDHEVKSKDKIYVKKSPRPSNKDPNHPRKVQYLPQELILKRSGTSEEMGTSKLEVLPVGHKNLTNAGEKKPQENILHNVEGVLQNWITVKTLIFLLGIEKFTDLYRIKDSSAEANEMNYKEGMNYDPEKREKMKQEYAMICQKLNSEEITDRRSDIILLNNQSSSDKSAHTGKSFKPKSKGKRKSPFKRSNVSSETASVTTESSVDSPKEPVLPHIDSISQDSVRRKVVLDKLYMVYTDILPRIRIESSAISSDLRELISTFRLTASTVTFRPSEWKLLGIFLLHMLRLKSQVIEEALRKSTSMDILNSYVEKFDSNNHEFDSFLSSVLYQNKSM